MFKFLKNFLKKDKQKTTNLLANKLLNEKFKKSFTGKLNPEIITTLEESLLKADIGVKTTAYLLDSLSELNSKEKNIHEIEEFLKAKLTEELYGSEQVIKLTNKPFIILASGVNGSGKTTSIGKLAAIYAKQNKKILIAAADTYRAAAVQQINVWAEKSNVRIIEASANKSDPAALAYKAVEIGIKENYDLVLIDTAGRLQNNQNFMEQLKKIDRVIKKLDNSAPHLSLLVLDGTTGQNSLKQLERFKEDININGLIITKLDGTAKGGFVIPIYKEYKIPIYYIGVGEKLEDLKIFNIKDYIARII
jgi:fused signal recognition particle receptor